jgi:uncharacterized membrane protein YgcG
VKRLLATALLCLGVTVGTAVPASAAVASAVTSAATSTGPAALATGTTQQLRAAATTDVDDFTFASYDADYWLTRGAGGDSELRTVETFVAQFPDEDRNRGMIRAIPTDYNGVPLYTAVESVVDENGDPVYYEEETGGGVVELALGTDEYLRGDHTFTISYTQRNVVRAFEDTNSEELYWDTNGTEFAQPFLAHDVRFHVDTALVESLTGNTACYVGGEGSGDTCELAESVDAAGAVFAASTTNLDEGENVTVAIGFEPGTFVVPEPPQPAVWAWMIPIGLMVLSGILALVAAVVRLMAPRDAAGRGTIIPEYSLPEELNLFEAGNLVRRDGTALPAALVSLAVRGNLQIVDDGDDDFSLRYLHENGTDAQETALLVALFGSKRKPGRVRDLTDTDADKTTALQKVSRSTKPAVLARGLRRPAPRGAGGALLAALVAVFVAALGVFIVVVTVSPAVSVSSALAIGITLLGVFIGVFCAYRPAILTDSGATLRDYVEGIRVYLTLAEKERFRVLQSPDGALRVDVADRGQVVKLYEKLLPYAVLWGIEKEWAQELAIQYRDEQPAWYTSSGDFNPVVFGLAMNSFGRGAVSAATPSYSGSGGGSFSGGSMGGGFSGGGGGGGGGGGR